MNLTKACNGTKLLPYVKAKLSALETDVGHIEKKWRGYCHESANFEDYVKEQINENVPTWDYLVSVGSGLRNCESDAIEVHPCNPDEATKVINKKKWSKKHLDQHYPKLEVQRWVWIASDTMLILEGISPEHFQVSQEGIELASRKGYQP